MGRYIARRLLLIPPVLALVSMIAFGIVLLLPGDPAMAILGEERSHDREAYEALRRELGLNQPIPIQYVTWAMRALQGDLGVSSRTQEPVASRVLLSLGPTLELSVLALAIALMIAVPLGVISATRPNSTFDLAGTAFGLSGIAMPSFLLGMLLIFTFGVQLRILPTGGFVDPSRNLGESLRLMLLPAMALGLGLSAALMRQIRSEMLEVLSADYVTTARAKGLREQRVVLRHAFRNALIPIITLIGVQIGRLFGGAVVIETIFAIPGMGRLAVQSIFLRDFPIVQAIVLIMALAVLLSNLVADMLYGVVDPRVAYD